MAIEENKIPYDVTSDGYNNDNEEGRGIIAQGINLCVVVLTLA